MNGESFKLLGNKYKIGKSVPMEVGDECIIHPTETSQATKSYPVIILSEAYNWNGNTVIGQKMELVIKGIRENENWYGAVLNEYGFNRLEFVKRNPL